MNCVSVATSVAIEWLQRARCQSARASVARLVSVLDVYIISKRVFTLIYYATDERRETVFGGQLERSGQCSTEVDVFVVNNIEQVLAIVLI